MNLAISFLEKNSIIHNDFDLGTVEDVPLSDAIHATKIAQLELLTELQEYIKDPNSLNAVIDDKIRKFKREHIKL